MTAFQSAREKFLATQQVAEELLADIASGVEADEPVLLRLDKLASSCAKLCYGNGLNSDLSSSIHNLIAWCDHLDDPRVKEEFKGALKASPLRAPW